MLAPVLLAEVEVEPAAFLAVVVTAAVAGTLAAMITGRGGLVPTVVAGLAIGTLLPVLSDSGELRTRFGGYLLAAGAVGEFGPILLLTLILSSGGELHNPLVLVGFVRLARPVGRGGRGS